MARELIINISCDFCRAPLTEDTVHSGEVVLESAVYHLDLCHTCTADLTGKLAPKPKAETHTAVREVPCDICGTKCKNERGLKFHKFRMHPGTVEKVKARK